MEFASAVGTRSISEKAENGQGIHKHYTFIWFAKLLFKKQLYLWMKLGNKIKKSIPIKADETKATLGICYMLLVVGRLGLQLDWPNIHISWSPGDFTHRHRNMTLKEPRAFIKSKKSFINWCIQLLNCISQWNRQGKIHILFEKDVVHSFRTS